MPMPRIEHVEDLDPDDGAGRSRLPDDHRRLLRHAPMGAARSPSARRSSKPTPIFTKLDPSVVDEERARLGVTA